ncbi:M48 family metallopeptidase [Thiolapillus brandeum]|uniref:Peptidase M48 n=1 Tax=Thiolapillus brandeum TaxID=1076588 RepID=A0A7U6JHH5_9GAMM|nr:M48 family metallopeptidase [Thiolapillus brandeum]BAO44331.1 peptidase M48 [Thiolapillus brandeum]
MDFFSAQDDARRKTRWLIVLFVLAILSLVVLTNLFIMLFVEYSNDYYVQNHTPMTFWQKFDWARFTAISLGVIVVVLAGSGIRTLSLRGGGKTVAEMMGGRLVSGNPRTPLERRLVNVVEEIAIASGTPVPQVYVMEHEPGINAFAAGYTTGDAVVAVTQGTLEKLNRAELQGVIAHEFSHIIHGDMRLNIRLIGLLFGILMVALIGRLLFRWGALGGSRNSKENNGIPLVVLGLGLIILGYVGVFFGNLIKAAVSRQREFLADASSVQFTRDPTGIAGALMKIGGDTQGAIINHPDAEELSHAYFGEGTRHMFTSLFATHPPLEQRIRKVLPSWDGQFLVPQKPDLAEIQKEEDAREQPRVTPQDMMMGGVILSSVLDNINQTEVPETVSVQEARRVLEYIPGELREAAEEPHGARALIYALILDEDHEVLEKQIWHLQDKADTGVAMLTEKHMKQVKKLAPKLRLTLVDLAMPALRQLSPQQYELFKENLQILIDMDGQVTAFEWALQRLILRHLEAHFKHRISHIGRYKHLSKLKDEIAIMLSYLAHHTHASKMDALHAFEAAARELKIEGMHLVNESDLRLEDLDTAMDKLAQLKPLLKPQLLKAAAACVEADGEVTALEMELLRAFSALLDCPLPPLPDPS